MLNINQVDTIRRAQTPLSPQFSYKSVYSDSTNIGLALVELYTFWMGKFRKPSAERLVFALSLSIFCIGSATQFLPSSKSQLGVQTNAQKIVSGNQAASKATSIASKTSTSQSLQTTTQNSPTNTFMNTSDLGSPLGLVTVISDVWLRSNAASNASIVGVLKSGQNLELFDDSNTFWYRVSYVSDSGQRLSGYVSSNFVSKTSPPAVNTPVVTPVLTDATTPVPPVIMPNNAVTITSTNLYSLAKDESLNVMAQLPEGLKVQITGYEGTDWTKISYFDAAGESITGFVKVSMLLINPEKL